MRKRLPLPTSLLLALELPISVVLTGGFIYVILNLDSSTSGGACAGMGQGIWKAVLIPFAWVPAVLIASVAVASGAAATGTPGHEVLVLAIPAVITTLMLLTIGFWL